MGEVKKMERNQQPTVIEEIRLPEWVERAVEVGVVAAAVAFAEGLAAWAASKK